MGRRRTSQHLRNKVWCVLAAPILLLVTVIPIVRVNCFITGNTRIRQQQTFTNFVVKQDEASVSKLHYFSLAALSSFEEKEENDSIHNNEHDLDGTMQNVNDQRRRSLLSKAMMVAGFTASCSSDSAIAASIPFLGSNDQEQSALSSSGFVPAKRWKAYFVDSTRPPTLIPIRDARQAAILKNLGNGLGTAKTPLIDESINLNNLLNKTIASGIDLVAPDPTIKNKQTSPSFVVMGMNLSSEKDAALAKSIMVDIMKPRQRESSAIGFSWIPQSYQSLLDEFVASGGGNVEQLKQALIKNLPTELVEAQLPLMKWAVTHTPNPISLVALAPELQDLEVVRKDGLQNLDIERRSKYVVDAPGFIQMTQNPSFKLYTDQSMLKDFNPVSQEDKASDYFAQRILMDETVATAAANWCISQPPPSPLMMIVSDLKDVRFMGGANGRLPRICRYLARSNDSSSSSIVVDDTSVTTILLNPNKQNTLSESNYIRTVIGTSPDTNQYQTKLADYIWFSQTPEVNVLPHMMNPL